MDELPVRVSGLRRRFGRREALAGVDLEVGAGEIVGLVGPNGSGKTTLLKALAGFLRPHGGDVRVFGRDPFRDQAGVMTRARFVFAPPALFDGLSAREHLVHLSALRTRAMPASSAADVERALEAVGLGRRADDRVATFSFGMRQRLALAQALLPRPDLLVLDEPTDGLDPLAVLELRALLAELRREHGISVLLSSHLMVEIEELVDRMLVLSEGRTLFHGPPADLVDGHVRLLARVSDPERAAAALAARGIACQRNGGAELELSRDALSLDETRAVLAAEGIELLAFHEHRPPLEQALLRTLRAHGAARGEGRA